MSSLRRVLLVSLLATIACAAAASATISYYASLTEANELFDAKLAQSARVLRALVGHELDRHSERPHALVVRLLDLDIEGEGEALATSEGHAYETKLAFQVLTERGRLLLRSDNAPVEPMAPLVRGFGRHPLGGEDWRTFVLRTSDGHWYLTAERDDIRAELAREIAVGTALPPLLALPLLALLIVLAVGWATRAIARVAGEVERRPADRLDPLDARGVPQELSGLVDALNRLFARVRATLEREKRFTADAAHELRTPISALKLHAQNLVAGAGEDERAASAAGIVRGIERCERLVAQLLELARLERGGLALEAVPLDLAATARQAIAELAPEALARGVEFELYGDDPVPAHGDRVLLAVLARNLVENAVRHGPAHSTVRVRVTRSDAGGELRVTDRGPGIPPELRERVFERFHREAAGDTPGSGLGLSIVARIAELHGARIELADAPGGGLDASVRFAAPSP